MKDISSDINKFLHEESNHEISDQVKVCRDNLIILMNMFKSKADNLDKEGFPKWVSRRGYNSYDAIKVLLGNNFGYGYGDDFVSQVQTNAFTIENYKKD